MFRLLRGVLPGRQAAPCPPHSPGTQCRRLCIETALPRVVELSAGDGQHSCGLSSYSSWCQSTRKQSRIVRRGDILEESDRIGFSAGDNGSMRLGYARCGASCRRPHHLAAVSGACVKGQQAEKSAEGNGELPEGGSSTGNGEVERWRDRALAGRHLQHPSATIPGRDLQREYLMIGFAVYRSSGLGARSLPGQVGPYRLRD